MDPVAQGRGVGRALVTNVLTAAVEHHDATTWEATTFANFDFP